MSAKTALAERTSAKRNQDVPALGQSLETSREAVEYLINYSDINITRAGNSRSQNNRQSQILSKEPQVSTSQTSTSTSAIGLTRTSSDSDQLHPTHSTITSYRASHGTQEDPIILDNDSPSPSLPTPTPLIPTTTPKPQNTLIYHSKAIDNQLVNWLEDNKLSFLEIVKLYSKARGVRQSRMLAKKMITRYRYLGSDKRGGLEAKGLRERVRACRGRWERIDRGHYF